MNTVQDPNKVRFDPETLNLFDEVELASTSINKQRPFSPEVQQKIARDFLPDRVTASLNMEGISVTRRQTLLMMDAMTLSENNTKAEKEIFNALQSDEFVYDHAVNNRPLTLNFIREVNRVLQDGILEAAGKFRQENVEISGAAFQPPDHISVPSELQTMLDAFGKMNANLSPVYKAVWLHATFTRIHPFEDGNGRTGRLLQDFVLLSAGLFSTGIPSARRDDYYDALEKADDGNWNPLCQMVCEFELKVLSRVSGIIEEIRSRGDFIKRIAQKASQQKTGGLHKQYLVWRQRMSNFGEQLKQTCDELDSTSEVIGVKTDLFEPIDFEKWKLISDKGHATNSWSIKQTWFTEGKPFFRTIFYFSRHFFQASDLKTPDELFGAVALKVTGGEAEPSLKYDFHNFSDQEIRLREILLFDQEIYRYCGTNQFSTNGVRSVEDWSCVTVDDYGEIIEEFVSDVFERKLGL
ncbi:Fic family protein [Celeribacter marinus]|uniref:Fic family protein n=1 Tax=Celeribacter marinus TaxID=1397108 RepID=UPI003F6BE8A8